MILDYEWKTGLVFGLEQDQVFMMDEEENLAEEPTSCINLHLGLVTVCFIFD